MRVKARKARANGWDCELWTLKPEIWASQIWILICLINNFVIALACGKSSKLITWEENIISVRQLALCTLLFFAFSSKVLNSDIKNLFWRSCLSRCTIGPRCLQLCCFCYCFYDGFIPKIILVILFLLFICISYLLKVFRFDTGILRVHVHCSN